MNIELNAQEIDFLKQYAAVYTEERNCDCTRDPLVAVRDIRKEISKDGYEDGWQYILDEEIFEDEGNIAENILNIITEGTDISDDDRDILLESIKYLDEESEILYNDYRIEHKPYKLHYVNVAYFLTRKEAERYIQYQSHNLTEPNVYAHSMGYSNRGDLQCLALLLKRMGTELNDQT